MRISDWSSDVCSSDLHIDRKEYHGASRSLRRDRLLLCVQSGNDHIFVGREDDLSDRAYAARCGYGHCRPCSVFSAATSQGNCFRRGAPRSEEHTSELQSLMRISYAVFCLKKKKK